MAWHIAASTAWSLIRCIRLYWSRYAPVRHSPLQMRQKSWRNFGKVASVTVRKKASA